MINSIQWRSCFLAIASIGTNLAVVYGLIVPTVGNRAVADFEFPPRLSLNSTQAIAVKSSLVSHKVNNQEGEVIKAHQKYRYSQVQGNREQREVALRGFPPLSQRDTASISKLRKKAIGDSDSEATVSDIQEISLDISYLVGTRGDVETYLREYTDIPPETIKAKKVKHIEGVGYHALFANGDRQGDSKSNRAYLSSCISPRSLSNVTQKQFSQFRYQNDLQLQVGLDWLQGKASIRDRRCLWILLSTPIMQSDPKTAYQVLENTWQDLYQWWLPNFPRLKS